MSSGCNYEQKHQKRTIPNGENERLKTGKKYGSSFEFFPPTPSNENTQVERPNPAKVERPNQTKVERPNPTQNKSVG